MSGICAVVLLSQALISANPATYQTALKEAQDQQRPLLVLIGATWCPGCQTMKQRVLPNMVRAGTLDSVSYAAVDFDREKEVASQLMRGSAIPQLIVFSRTATGQWHREQIVGETSEANVRALIDRAVKAQQPRLVESSGPVGN